MVVNGIQYQRPEEIPDPHDREKINQLIARLTNDDSEEDAEFDKTFANFDQEFNQAVEKSKHESNKMLNLMTGIFLSIAVLLLAIAGFSGYQSYRQMAAEKKAPGRIVDITIRRSYDSSTQDTNRYAYPVVEFSVQGRVLKDVELSEGEWPPTREIGDEVTILYNPERPREARIESTSSTVLLWIVPGITGFIGAVFLFVVFMISKLRE